MSKKERFEKIAMQKLRSENSLKGNGLYVFQNNTKGDLYLPKPPSEGASRLIKPVDPKVPNSGQFQGDSYFMNMVKTHELRLVREVVSANEGRMEEKLILDQPDTVKDKGKVEQVLQRKEILIQESENDSDNPEVLLNENPMDGIEILD